MAGATGLEPATSGVTGRRSNQLSYAPAGENEAVLASPRWGVKHTTIAWDGQSEAGGHAV